MNPRSHAERARTIGAACTVVAVAILATALSLPSTQASGGDGRPGERLTGVRVVERATSIAVELPITSLPRMMVLARPHRLVIDVPVASGLPGAPELTRWRVDRWGVREIRTSQFSRNADETITRLVLEMDHRPRWELEGGPLGYAVLVAAEPDGEGPLVFGVLPALPEFAAPGPPDELPGDAASEAAAGVGRTAGGERSDTADGIDATDATDTTGEHTVDAAPESAFQHRPLSDRRAAELIADAEVKLAAASYREGLESLARVFTSHPSSRHVVRARTLAAEFACALHFGDEAVSHLLAAFADTTGAVRSAHGAVVAAAQATGVVEPIDSVLARGARLLATCPLRPESWHALSELHTMASRRLGPSHPAVTDVASTLGIALAEAGQSLDRARELLIRGLERTSDPARTAELHRGLGLCHEHADDRLAAAAELLIAARLTVANDRDASLALRLRAADNYYRADALEPATEQYRLVSDLEEVADELRCWALFQLGNCYYRARRFDLAAETFTAVEGAFPSSFWADQARTRLAAIRRTGVTIGS